MSEIAHQAAIKSLRLDARRRLETEGSRLENAVNVCWRYELPPCYPLCDRDAERLEHRDLERMKHNELTAEAWRIRLTLSFGDLARPAWARGWLTERLERAKSLLKEGGT